METFSSAGPSEDHSGRFADGGETRQHEVSNIVDWELFLISRSFCNSEQLFLISKRA